MLLCSLTAIADVTLGNLPEKGVVLDIIPLAGGQDTTQTVSSLKITTKA